MTITLTREEAQMVLDAMCELKHDTFHPAKVFKHEPSINLLLARLRAPEPEPVAWRTFDGEGGYDYRDYELNEDYGYWWGERHPNHKGWVRPLYTDPTPCQTCEALARTVMMDQTSHDTPPQREWQGLTDEEMADAWAQSKGDVLLRLKPFAHAIEDKLREKNGNL